MRRRLVLALGVVFLLLAGWWLFEWVARIDRYRPLAETELERLSGLPVSIGRLDLRLLPVPHVSALRVRLGEGDFEAAADRIGLVPALGALLRGRIELRSIQIAELSLAIPEYGERITEAWRALRERIEAADPQSEADAPLDVRIDRVEASDVTLLRGPGRERVASVEFSLEHLASRNPAGLRRAEGPGAGHTGRSRRALLEPHHPRGGSAPAIEFDALRGVSSILQPIPIAGDALKVAHVRLLASGSPYQMKLSVASFRDQVVGASMAVPNATVTRIRDALDLLKSRPKAADPGGEAESGEPLGEGD